MVLLVLILCVCVMSYMKSHSDIILCNVSEAASLMVKCILNMASLYALLMRFIVCRGVVSMQPCMYTVNYVKEGGGATSEGRRTDTTHTASLKLSLPVFLL